MTDKSAFLVVGADSLVGAGTLRALAGRGLRSYGTTRRRDTLGPDRVFLDFEAVEPFRAPADVSHAFLIAAATNYERCEKDPMARVINVELVPRTVERLLAQGLSVTFISTNSVFGGDRPMPGENDPHAPGIPYAQQKSDGEAVVRAAAERLGASDRLSIVRLTKIMNAGVPPLPNWFAAWRRGEVVEPFEDLIFAPMSVRFVGESLAVIGQSRTEGNLHLSGAQDVSYPVFAAALAQRLGVDPGLIRPVTSVSKGIHIAFKPRFSGIGMARTTRLTGLSPQPLASLADDIIADWREHQSA